MHYGPQSRTVNAKRRAARRGWVASGMNAEEVSRLVEEAGFVFKGKVIRPEGVGLPDAARGAVAVEVQEVLYGTDVMRGLVGTVVTVLTEEAAALSEGDERVFYTNVVSLGEEVVARAVTHHDASDESLAAVAEGIRMSAERPLAERIASADLVVVGQVTSAKRLAGDAPPESEHDPEWAIARVSVESVIKGRTSRKTVEVLYASSRDIAWYKSPKLEDGASGVFILRTRREDEAPPEVALTVYQATDPLDFQPHERLSDVRRMAGQEAER
jgi:hypothetical protein